MKTLCLLLLWTGIARAQSDAHWVLLPASAAAEVSAQCSRSAPTVQAGWTPSAADVAGLEKHLFLIAGLASGDPQRRTHVAYPENFYRQYVGVIVNGHQFIYINAGTDQLTGRAREHVSVVCDGDDYFWGVLYDPATSQFSDLQTNGRA